MWRLSITDVRELRDNFKRQSAFPKSWHKQLKIAPVWMSSTSESQWWYLFHMEVKSRDSTTWFIFWWQFQIQDWNRHVEMNFLADLFLFFFFWGDGRIIWKRESIPIEWHQCRLLTRKRSQLSFCLHICSLWSYLPQSHVHKSPIYPDSLKPRLFTDERLQVP
jgi:hypothetical protein